MRLLAVCVILFLTARSIARSNPSDGQCEDLGRKVVALVNEYRELRERRRHLPEGAHDKDLRDYGGKLHSVLESLGKKLGHPPYTRKTIVGCLGEPDAIWNHNQIAPYLGIYERERKRVGRVTTAKRNREYLVYYWRGGHDFLFFINENGRIIDHGWWFAYE